MNLTRVTSTLGAGAVATIAAWSSWTHMVHVAVRFGEKAPVAYFLPLSVDGLLIVASAAMVDDRQAGRKPRGSAKLAFAIGVAASIGANIAAAHQSLGARIVAAWPAVALLLVVELLTQTGKPRPFDPYRPDTPYAPELVSPVYDHAAPIGPEPAPVKRLTPRSLTAQQRVTAAHHREPEATHERVAEMAGCSVATVKRHRPKRSVSGSPSGEGAAETPVNGQQPALL